MKIVINFLQEMEKNNYIKLEMKYENKDIGKLEQFKIKPMLLEEIYLP